MLIRPRGLPFPCTVTSALLLLSSLSLQALALHARQRNRQVLVTAQTIDAERSVAMAFQQHAAGAHACLLALPSSEWDGSERCPGLTLGSFDPAALRMPWQLLDWQPQARELEPCSCAG